MLPLGQINYLKHDLIIYALEIIESAPRPSEFFQMQSYFSNRHRPCMHQQQQNNKTESKLNTLVDYILHRSYKMAAECFTLECLN